MPPCKKTFSPVTETPVADIAEIVAEAIILSHPDKKKLLKSYLTEGTCGYFRVDISNIHVTC